MSKITIPDSLLSQVGYTNIYDVDNQVRKILTPVVNQINSLFSQTAGELAEVREVYAIENQLPLTEEGLPNYKLLGAIKIRTVLQDQYLSEEELPIAVPLDPNIKSFPVKGEYVFVESIFGDKFYSRRINIHNNPNNSSHTGLSSKFSISSKNSSDKKTLETANTGIAKNVDDAEVIPLGDFFQSDFNFRQLIPNEGDVIVSGRFGNSVRLGSNIVNGVQNSPNVKLRAGQLQDAVKFDEEGLVESLNESRFVPVTENINSDGSSLWMTTDEVIPLKPATFDSTDFYLSTVKEKDRIEEFGGKQVVLNSGRLIFNSKESGIYGFSNGPVEISTLNGFGISAQQYVDINSPIIEFGRGEEKTKAVNVRTVNFDVENTKGYSTLASKGIRLGQGNYEPAVKGNELQDILTDMMDTISDLASAVTTIAVTPITIPVLVTPTPQAYASEAAKTAQVMSLLAGLQIKLNRMLSRVVEVE